MTPDLTHLTRITTGPWQIGDVYRAYDTDGVRSGEWRRIETLCSTSIDAYSRMWPTAEVYRYVPPVVPPVWIRSTDRFPTAADLPIIVRHKSGGDTIWSDHVRGGIDYLWLPFIPPAEPAPTQAELDRHAYDRWMGVRSPKDTVWTAWQAACAYTRSTPVKP